RERFSPPVFPWRTLRLCGSIGLMNRRDFLWRAGGGCGGLALSWLLARDRLRAAAVNPLAAKKPHFEARAKSVIFLFMVGGPSHIDLFDPKPELAKRHGQPLPESFGKPVS